MIRLVVILALINLAVSSPIGEQQWVDNPPSYIYKDEKSDPKVSDMVPDWDLDASPNGNDQKLQAAYRTKRALETSLKIHNGVILGFPLDRPQTYDFSIQSNGQPLVEFEVPDLEEEILTN